MIPTSVPLAGVFGFPIGHSLSPLLHNHWLSAAGLKGHYVPLECHPEDLSDVMTSLLKTGFVGFNVTSPHKERMFALTDQITQRAKSIGAVNTVWREGDTLHGDTTDGDGFLASLPKGCDLSHCVILGAGGASKAISYALCETGRMKRLHILNRTPERAREVVQTISPHFPDISMVIGSLEGAQGILANATLLINCTSLGMTGKPPLNMDLSPCPGDMTVYDTVYSPAITPFMAQALKRGLKTVGGLGMLIEQGRPGFEKWFGAPAPITGEEHALLAHALGQNIDQNI